MAMWLSRLGPDFVGREDVVDIGIECLTRGESNDGVVTGKVRDAGRHHRRHRSRLCRRVFQGLELWWCREEEAIVRA